LLSKFTLGEHDELHLLNLLVESCLSLSVSGTSSSMTKIFPWIVTALYTHDVLCEDTILRWWRRESEWQYAATGAKMIRASVAGFIQWLEEAEEEDDDGAEQASDSDADSSSSSSN